MEVNCQVTELGLEQFDLVYEEAAGLHRRLHRNKQDVRLSWIIQQHLNRLTSEQKNFLIDLSVYRLPFDREAVNYIKKEEKSKAQAAYENSRKLSQAMGLDKDVEDCNQVI